MSLKIFTDPSMTVDAYPAMRVGDQQIEVRGEHLFVITATKELGCDTGRRRYRVVCRSCGVVVHPATTGPQQNMEFHLREDARTESRRSKGADLVSDRREDMWLVVCGRCDKPKAPRGCVPAKSAEAKDYCMRSCPGYEEWPYPGIRREGEP